MVLTIAILGRLFYGLDAWWEGFSNAYWGTALWLTFVKTFVVILPPTLCMGGPFRWSVRCGARTPGGWPQYWQCLRLQYARGYRGLLGDRFCGHSTPGDASQLGAHGAHQRGRRECPPGAWLLQRRYQGGCTPTYWGSLSLCWWPRRCCALRISPENQKKRSCTTRKASLVW